jgi:hypothetical protein
MNDSFLLICSFPLRTYLMPLSFGINFAKYENSLKTKNLRKNFKSNHIKTHKMFSTFLGLIMKTGKYRNARKNVEMMHTESFR